MWHVTYDDEGRQQTAIPKQWEFKNCSWSSIGALYLTKKKPFYIILPLSPASFLKWTQEFIFITHNIHQYTLNECPNCSPKKRLVQLWTSWFAPLPPGNRGNLWGPNFSGLDARGASRPAARMDITVFVRIPFQQSVNMVFQVSTVVLHFVPDILRFKQSCLLGLHFPAAFSSAT